MNILIKTELIVWINIPFLSIKSDKNTKKALTAKNLFFMFWLVLL